MSPVTSIRTELVQLSGLFQFESAQPFFPRPSLVISTWKCRSFVIVAILMYINYSIFASITFDQVRDRPSLEFMKGAEPKPIRIKWQRRKHQAILACFHSRN